jgi:hypothetical protein
MIPNDSLSIVSQPSAFFGGKSLKGARRVDYEDGGIGLNDSSAGLKYQVWTARIVGDDVLISAPNTAEELLFTAVGITEISLAFDQNMRPMLAFVQDGEAKLRWYDSLFETLVVTDLPAGSISPKISMDDKRPELIQYNDVILAYISGGNLYFRQQRDRFDTEYLLKAGVVGRLVKVGMNVGLRFQFQLKK